MKDAWNEFDYFYCIIDVWNVNDVWRLIFQQIATILDYYQFMNAWIGFR